MSLPKKPTTNRKAAPKSEAKKAPAGKSPGGKKLAENPIVNDAPPKLEVVKDGDKAKLSLKIKNDNYVAGVSATGAKTYNNGDDVALMLTGVDVPTLLKVTEEITGEEIGDKYGHLNVGMQRMNLGNKIRAFLKKNPEKVGSLKTALITHAPIKDAS